MKQLHVTMAAALCLLALSAAAVDKQLVAEIGEALGNRHALIVHVGAGKGDLALALAEQNGGVVHGLEPDAAAVAASREQVLKAGRCGRVTIEEAPLKQLPYVGQLANAVVIDDWKRVSEAGLDPNEIVRVLATFGTACIGQSERFGNNVKAGDIEKWLKKAGIKKTRTFKKDGVWVLFTKTRPEGMDVWTHKWHDNTRNHGSQDTVLGLPSSLHWINSTAYTWSLRQYRASDREVFYFFYNKGGLSRWAHRKKPTQTIEAYDAYSGIALWSREMPEPASSFEPIIASDRIILTTRAGDDKKLQAISRTTGEDIMTYEDAGIPADGVVLGDVLVWMMAGLVKGVDIESGKILWERKATSKPRWDRRKGAVVGFQEYCIVAADGMVFLADRIEAEPKKITTKLIGLDVKTGKETWSCDDPRLGTGYHKYFYYDGRLILSNDKGFLGIPVSAKGDAWHIPVMTYDKNGKRIDKLSGGASKSCFAFDGLVWIREGGQYRMILGEEEDKKRLEPAKMWVGFDVHTGKEKKRVGYEVGGGWQQRCFPDLGCPAFIISSNNEFVDLETGKITQNRGLRGNCGEGPFFGNGLYYMTPHYCCFCFPMVRGGIAMGSDTPPQVPVSRNGRLEKGPAYTPAMLPKPMPPDDGAWPTYRYNMRRTCGTATQVKTPLAEKPLWQENFGERITQVIAASDTAYITVVNQGRICARDAKTGKILWDFVAGSRIDTPPALYCDQLLFGCHDGTVYALRNGKLAWKYHAAPDKRRMLVRDRIESSWPIAGALLIADNTLYGLAGRITSCDGGMILFALDAISGKEQWRKTVTGSNHEKLRTGIDCWHEPQGELCNAILLKRDDELLLTDEHMLWRFKAENGEQIIPEDSSALELSLCSEKVPWMGMDRPTWMANFHGENFVPEIRFPYGNGTPTCFVDPAKPGLIFKRLRKDRVMEIFPSKAADLHKTWEATKNKVPLDWEPVRTKVDVHAYCAAGDVCFIAGPEFDPATTPATGELRAISIKDGKDLGVSIPLPASPVYDGLSAAYGRVYVACQDGTLMCLGQ